MTKNLLPFMYSQNKRCQVINYSWLKIRSIVFLLIILQSTIFSQNGYNFSQFSKESFQFVTQPTKWESNDWLKIGLISAGTILLMQADQPIRENVLRNQSHYKSLPIEAGRIWGEGYPTAILAGAFGLHGLITNDRTTKKIGFEIIQSAIYSGAITSVLKFAVGRARPFTNKGEANYVPFSIFDDDYHSLPSGHVALAFSLSTVLSKNAKSDFLKVLAYLPALLTAVSRVYQDNHWASDVFLGAAIGYFIGNWVVDLHEENKPSIETISISPLSIRIAIF